MAPSSTGRLSGLRSALPLSNTTPGSLISSLNEQPAASTRSPFGVPGHLSTLSTTPSPSLSNSHPFSSTLAPAGVFGHWSRLSPTPSPSLSTSQPLASTLVPAGVPGHLSTSSAMPSPSVSITRRDSAPPQEYWIPRPAT